MQLEQEFQFCPELVRLYRSEFAEGSGGERFALSGCSTANNLISLARLFQAHRPSRTLEIGLCLGGTCLLFTALHQMSAASPARQHVAIDPFQRSRWKNAGLLAVERSGTSGYLDFREELSAFALPRLASENARFDLVYIDGSHLFEDVFVDFYYTARLLNPGGLVAFDDCSDPHVSKVLQFLCANLSGMFDELDLAPFRADHGRSLRYRAARILGRLQMRAFRKVGTGERTQNARFRSF